MSNVSVFANMLSPGLKVVESADSSRVLPIQSHTHIYLFGSVTVGTPYIPTVISSYVDFANKFGNNTANIASTEVTHNAVRLIFKNDSTANVYFVRVGGNPNGEPNGDVADYLRGIETLEADDEYPGGFIICPGAFSSLEAEADRIAVANAMIAKAEELDMMALLDSSAGLNTAPTLMSDIIEEADLYQASATGHAAFYHPHVVESVTGNNAKVPASCVAASIATARFKTEGYKPNGGLKYPVKGVVGPVVKISRAEQDVLDPVGINVLRKIRNQGTVIWGMRTRQTALLYRYVHYRVIANVVNRTFRESIELKRQLFDVIDGQGLLFAYLEEAANSVGRQLYQSGLLFGATEVDAFAAKCDFENNTPDMIQQGYVYVEFTYSISPAVEKMVVNTRLTNIGAVGASNETGRVEETATDSEGNTVNINL